VRDEIERKNLEHRIPRPPAVYVAPEQLAPKPEPATQPEPEQAGESLELEILG